MLEFIESKPFTNRLVKIAGEQADDVLWAIQSDLLKNPQRGNRVEGLSGVRKARTCDPSRGKGKRGGFRYVYIYFVKDEQIGLLFLFDKGEKDDLNKEEKNCLPNWRAREGKVSIFAELKQALEEVRDYRAGRRADLRVTRFKAPRQVRPREVVKIRKSLHFSQREFALLLNTSIGTIRSWEQGSRRPQSTALLVLTMAKTNPAVLLAR